MPTSDAFTTFMAHGWEASTADLGHPLEVASWAEARRRALCVQFPRACIAIGSGGLKTRSNDTDHRFRPHSAFAHLTGLGADCEPDAVLLLVPTGSSADDKHVATLYVRPRSPIGSFDSYADARLGELWAGRRRPLQELSDLTGLATAPTDQLADRLRAETATTHVRATWSELPADLQEVLADHAREPVDASDEGGASKRFEDDVELLTALSELRLVKDDFEVDQLREACAQTATGFQAVVADLSGAIEGERGERHVEGLFNLHARRVGNAVGYDVVAAAGEHACTLHWIRNDGDLQPGDLLLLDAGVELDSLYTADVTRTLPVSGTFTAAQRKVYEAVLAAQDAGIRAAQPGAPFTAVHEAATRVIAEHLDTWGLLPVPLEDALSARGGQHRRWMLHGTSHHLGLDVHDCAQARQQNYHQGTLRPGMVITVEPGLYFHPDDRLVPAELRGIGVRIEDDILITADGNDNLSVALPRTAEDVETWVRRTSCTPAGRTPLATGRGALRRSAVSQSPAPKQKNARISAADAAPDPLIERRS